jgi:hypothetical protein
VIRPMDVNWSDVSCWHEAANPGCPPNCRYRGITGHAADMARSLGCRQSGCTHHACFATRLGGVSGGKETQGWRDSSHAAMVGAGKFGSAKLPMATATYPGNPSFSQYTVEPHVGQK